MRITAGNLKNKEVLAKKKTHIKPTSSRVREAIFNLLNHGKFLSNLEILNDENPSIIENRVIADIFCGTGILGFEALSRGAKKVVFIDQSPESLQIARSNANSLGVSEKCNFIQSDATNLINCNIEIDLVFLDPPYNKNLVIPTLKSIVKNNWIKKGGLVMAEHGKLDKIEEISGLSLIDNREYNNTRLAFFKAI
ncbi:MAG: 16S rRNA (guanine(966)-N(2))-methyltransferase RsmD [Rickettsiales bacterium]|nr:16S rRNA (guanine(966)-N(2))-methyltransferase RsmD [Rickettsiales bacterium]